MTQRHRLPTDTDTGLLLIISGPSGVGKTTITRGVERSISDAIFSISVTTREKTLADVEGVDYRFIDNKAFDAMISDDDFLEHAEVFGNKYGTPRAWVEEQLERGRVVILEIDVQGAKQVKRIVPDAFAVFIMPPDDDTLFTRLRNRKREPEEAIKRRFAEATREIAMARESGVYDEFVINDVLEHAIHSVIALVKERRSSG